MCLIVTKYEGCDGIDQCVKKGREEKKKKKKVKIGI